VVGQRQGRRRLDQRHDQRRPPQVESNPYSAKSATYSKPPSNPVAVSVDYTSGTKAPDQSTQNLTQLVSNITVLPCDAAGSVSGCALRYNGSTSGTYTDPAGVTYQFDAKVDWIARDQLGGRYINYIPSGEVTIRSVKAGDCDVKVTPAVYTIQPLDGTLSIDFGVDPPSWGGASTSNWNATLTITCPDDTVSTGSAQIGVLYFGGNQGGTLAPRGTGFFGSSNSQGTTLSYDFMNAAQPPKAPGL
jgi:hypothetical protein